MTSSLKCRANNPAVCTDPNCPEKRGAREAFIAQAVAQEGQAAAREAQKANIRGMLTQAVDLGNISSRGEDYVDRLRSNLNRLLRAKVSSKTVGEAYGFVVDHGSTRVPRLGDISKAGLEHIDELVEAINVSVRQVP